VTDFAAVDAGDVCDPVAMMDATRCVARRTRSTRLGAPGGRAGRAFGRRRRGMRPRHLRRIPVRLTWVPHARLARDLPATLATLGAADVQTRHDTVTISAWIPTIPRSATAHRAFRSTRSRAGTQPTSRRSPAQHGRARSARASPSSRVSPGS